MSSPANKRKSFGKQNGTPQGKKQKFDGSPKQIPNAGGKPNIGKFAGNKNLKNENKPFIKGAAPKKQNVKQEPANGNEKAALNRSQKRRDKFKHKRVEQRNRMAELREKAQEGDVAARREIQDKIDALEKVENKSKNCIKKIGNFKRLLSGDKKIPHEKQEKKHTGKVETQKPKQGKQKQEQKKIIPKVQAEAETSEEEEVAADEQQNDDDSDEQDDSLQSDQEDQEEDDDSNEEVAEDSDDDEEEVGEDSDDQEKDDDEEDDSEEEAEAAPPAKIPKKQGKQNPSPKIQDVIGKKPSRYVVFVGNLPYTASKEEITKHFEKIGEIVDIRIPTDHQTNKPKGFAYVEVGNQECYEKALSLHHSSLGGRRINVMYTQGGKKNSDAKKGDIKAKNFKLQGMRKQGLLAGSVKADQKRSARRGKRF